VPETELGSILRRQTRPSSPLLGVDKKAVSESIQSRTDDSKHSTVKSHCLETASINDEEQSNFNEEYEDSEDNLSASVVDITATRDVLPKVKECDWVHFVNRFSQDEELCALEILAGGCQLDKDIVDEEHRRRVFLGSRLVHFEDVLLST
jgi:hypothetical protein